jgi:hypothetical protein
MRALVVTTMKAMTTKPVEAGDVATAIERDLIVEEIFDQFCRMGARLYDFDFYARAIPPLQDAFGPAAVAAAFGAQKKWLSH